MNISKSFNIAPSRPAIQALLVLAAPGILLTGCLFKANTVEPRRFVLTPLPATECATNSERDISVYVCPVQIPAYLSQRTLLVRKSASEVDYINNSVWAERLEDGIQRVLAANLSLLLPSSRVETASGEHCQARVAVSLEQFDVDKKGHGILIARWRLSAAGSNKPLKTGEARLARSGAAPGGKPQSISETLSVLTADLSRLLAQAVRENAAQLQCGGAPR